MFEFSAAPLVHLVAPALALLSPPLGCPTHLTPAPTPGSGEFAPGPAEMLYPEVGHKLPGLRRSSHPAAPSHRRGGDAEALRHPMDEGLQIELAPPALPVRCLPPFHFPQHGFHEGTAPENPLVRHVRLPAPPQCLHRLPPPDTPDEAAPLKLRAMAQGNPGRHEPPVSPPGARCPRTELGENSPDVLPPPGDPPE